MKVIFGLPQGAVVLPGLDLLLDAASWDALSDHPEHAQAGLDQLLKLLGAARGDALPVKGSEPDDGQALRLKLISEALRPAATIGGWPDFMGKAPAEEIRDCLAPVSLVTAPTEQDEAAAIALILREVMETPERTANLVTPDRTLARRVAAELGRWGIRIDAGAGEPLRATPAGLFHDLIAEAAATGSQIAILSLLKHPLTRLGLAEGAAQHAARDRRDRRHAPALVRRRDWTVWRGAWSGRREEGRAIPPSTG